MRRDDRKGEFPVDRTARIHALIKRSSLNSPAARELQERVPAERVAMVRRRAATMEPEMATVAAAARATANLLDGTNEEAGRRLGDRLAELQLEVVDEALVTVEAAVSGAAQKARGRRSRARSAAEQGSSDELESAVASAARGDRAALVVVPGDVVNADALDG